MGIFRYLKNQFRHDRNMKRAFEAEYRLLDRQLHSFNQAVVDGRCQERMDYLKDKTLHSTQSGVSNERYCDYEVIVSLTSFGKRIYDVFLAIESIMQGTIKPNRIVLWLAEEEFGGKVLPRTLQLQQSRGLEVRFCEDLRSYKKLIPALKQYPEACIITIDDDLIYEFDIVERLVGAHWEHPNSVCACRVHRMTFDEEHVLKSYMDWEWEYSVDGREISYIFPTTGGGVLFPPHCFSEEVFNKEVFMDICPYADDVWFYAMALINNTHIVQVFTGKPEGYYLELPSSSIDALYFENTNSANCRNDVQIKAVFEKYNLYEKTV